MMLRAPLFLSLALAACAVEPIDPGDGSGSGSGSGSNMNNPNEVSGAITQSATWSGTITVKGPTTIKSGVTITVAAGTTINFIGSNNLSIEGTFDAQGTAAAKVNLKPQTGTFFGGLNNSGTLKLTHVIQKGGGIYSQAGSVTITDSQLSGVQGDLIVLGGGAFTASYSQFGVPGDTTHCQLHFNAGGPISISKSDIIGAPYGFMIAGASGTFVDNNWRGNEVHLQLQTMPLGTFTNNWFEASNDDTKFEMPSNQRPTSAPAAITGTGPRS